MSDQRISELRATLREGLSPEDALRQVEALLRDCPHLPELWCLRGDLVQLSDGREYRLTDAEESYRRALEIDSNWAEAFEDLGYLYDKVYDDPRTAVGYFEKAIALGRDSSRRGLRDVLRQLRKADAGNQSA